MIVDGLEQLEQLEGELLLITFDRQTAGQA